MQVRPAEYARIRGVSRQAVHKAIKDQRIPVHEVNGTVFVDVEEANAAWSANTDPSNVANSETGQPEISVPSKWRSVPGEDPGGQIMLMDVPQTTRREAAVARQRANGKSDESKASGPAALPYGRAFASARADRERWHADEVRMRVLERQGELVRAGDVEDAAFQCARRARDLLLSLSSRLAPTLVGLEDPREIERLIEEEAKRICLELMEPAEPERRDGTQKRR